jgi:hypothetical protein
MIQTKGSRNPWDQAIGAYILHDRERDDADYWLERGWAEESWGEDCHGPRDESWICHNCRALTDGKKNRIIHKTRLSWICLCDTCYLENTGKKRPIIGGPKA